MKKGKKSTSITFKMSLYLAMLITILMASVGFGNYYSITTAFKAQNIDQGWIIASSTSAAAAEYLQTGNSTLIREHLNNIRANEDISYAAIVNTAGVILAHTDQRLVGLNEFSVVGVPPNGTVRVYTDNTGKPAGNDFIAPVIGKEGSAVGYFQLGINNSRYEVLLKDMIINMLMIFFAAILAGIMLARVMANRILRQPISDLSVATENIAAGNFAHQVPVRQLDELGSLATAFNLMSGHLANLFISVKTSTKELAQSSQSILNRSDELKLVAENACREKNYEQAGIPGEPELNVQRLLDAQQEITSSAKRMARLVDRLNNLAIQFKLT